MNLVSVYSDKKDFKENVKDLVQQLKTELGEEPQLIVVFPSRMFIDYAASLPNEFRQYLPKTMVAGCIGSVLMVDDREEAFNPGIVAMGAVLPKVSVEVVHIDPDEAPGEDASPADWVEYTGVEVQENQHFLLFADPFSAGVETVLQGLDYAYTCPVSGGFSSGTQFAGEVSLFAGEKAVHSGVVLLSLSGEIEIVSLVAQGCRPVGENLTINECDDLVLSKVNGVSPIDYLNSLAEVLDETDVELLQSSSFLGVEMDTLKTELSHGDYLIRNICGINPENGSLVIGDQLQKGEVVRFHVRDPQSCRAELEDMTSSFKAKFASRRCKGILLFSCLGRVEEFYGEKAVDSKLVRAVQEDAPLCGFFCSGEIGQVGSNTYIHGYTASALYFYEPGE